MCSGSALFVLIFGLISNFTEEEINAMKQALDKYGIQMPAFGKIGGILAGEVGDYKYFTVLGSRGV